MPQFTNKHILLDTCFIIKAFQYSKTSYFDDLFLFLKDNNCVPIINNFIEFEFMMGCRKVEHIENKRNYLNFFLEATLPIHPNIIKDATIISNIYSNKGVHHNQISMIDCCNSAF